MKKVYWFNRLIILFVMTTIISSNFLIVGSSKEVSTYVCNDVQAQGFYGGTKYEDFNNDYAEFATTSYNKIDEDDENYIYDNTPNTGEAQYHRFDFTINEDVSDIGKIDITWKGYGGGIQNVYPPKPPVYSYSLWVKGDSSYQLIDTGSMNSKDTVHISYDSNFSDIVHDGHIYVAASSNYHGDFDRDSFLYSYYVEVKIAYETTPEPQLGISAPSSVTEGDSFQVTVTADSTPVENVMVNFSGSTYYTLSDGTVDITAPLVDQNTSYPITAYKLGYLFDETTILVTDNTPPAEPQLVITAPSSVVENNSFQVSVTADSIPVENAMVNFSGSTYYTLSDGTVDITAPLVDGNTDFLITAYKYGHVSDSTIITVTDSIPPVEPQLVITAPSSTVEENVFQVSVTADGTPIEDVMVNFSDSTYYTGSDGTVTLTAPSVDVDSDYSITAYKTSYVSDSTSITVTDSSTSTEPQLAISAPSSVVEGNSFQVTVTANDAPVEDALVSFSGTPQYTDSNGIVTLAAPSVNGDTNYLLTAGKTGYQSRTVSVKVLNHEEIVSHGYIHGKVSDTLENPIEDVEVCIVSSGTSNVKKCVFTDENGEYTVSSSTGTYSVETRKDGYLASIIDGIDVQADTGTEVDFTLQKESVDVDEASKSVVDYIIKEEIKKGSIVGAVDVSTDEEQVSLYGNASIELISTDLLSDEGIKVVVSGNETPGTKVVMYLGVLDNPDGIVVTYDGVEIEQNTDVESFFNDDNDNAEWMLSSTEENGIAKFVLIINIPHYSEHEITVTMREIAGSLSGLPAVLSYIGIFAIIAIIFVGIGVIRRRF